jgi:hypothetical protein
MLRGQFFFLHLSLWELVSTMSRGSISGERTQLETDPWNPMGHPPGWTESPSATREKPGWWSACPEMCQAWGFCQGEVCWRSVGHRPKIITRHSSPLFFGIPLTYIYIPPKNLSIYLSIYLSIHLSIHPSIHLSIDRSIYRSIYLSIYLLTYLPIYLATYILPYLSIYLSFCLSIYLSIYLSIHRSIYQSIYLI